MVYKIEERDFLISAGCPTRYLSAAFNNYSVYDIKQSLCVEAVKKIGNKWLCMVGETGTGKTHLAISLMREKITESGGACSCIYSGVKKIIDAILAADFTRKQEIISNLSNASFLIIDEIGRSIETKYFQDVIFEILNNRYNEFKQTVIISNLSKEELFGKYFDSAIARRISEMGEIINFNWPYYTDKNITEVTK